MCFTSLSEIFAELLLSEGLFLASYFCNVIMMISAHWKIWGQPCEALWAVCVILLSLGLCPTNSSLLDLPEFLTVSSIHGECHSPFVLPQSCWSPEALSRWYDWIIKLSSVASCSMFEDLCFICAVQYLAVQNEHLIIICYSIMAGREN